MLDSEEHYMVIYSVPHDTGIYVIPRSKITPEKMEEEVCEFPYWIMSNGEDSTQELSEEDDYEDDCPKSECNIEEIGIPLSSQGKNNTPYNVTRIFFYEFA